MEAGVSGVAGFEGEAVPVGVRDFSFDYTKSVRHVGKPANKTYDKTLWPFCSLVTPSPTSLTVPAASMPKTKGNSGMKIP